MSAVEQKWSFVAALIPITALPFIIWTWKAVLWDKIIMAGTTSTPALTGTLGTVYITVMGAIFLHVWIKS